MVFNAFRVFVLLLKIKYDTLIKIEPIFTSFYKKESATVLTKRDFEDESRIKSGI